MLESPLPNNGAVTAETEPQPTAVVRPASSRRNAFVPQLPQDNGAALDEWLLSYADMVTLLLTMFVALLLNAHFDEAKPGGQGAGPRQMIEQLFQLHVASPYNDEQGYTITTTRGTTPELAPDQGAAIAVVKDEDLERIRRREEAVARVRYRLKATNLETFISASAEGDGIRLNIPNSILFISGAADLQGRGPDVLRALGPILNAERFIVSVEGHTDNAPIKTDRFPSNWELSAQRAATVVRALEDAGIEARRLQAVGYGDSRPLADNGTEDGRRENRRVTLFLRAPN